MRKSDVFAGDFHRGNLFFRPSDAVGSGGNGDCAVLDWAFYGSGHCCWELLYFMNNVWASKEVEMDMAEEQMLLRL